MPSAGVHFYLANRLGKKGLDRDKFFLGNLLPDMEHVMRPREELKISPLHWGSEHWERKRLLESFKDKSIREGIKMHFLVDDYVHYHYVLPKIKKFRKKGRSEVIHYLTEIVMDGVLGKKDKKTVEFFEGFRKRIDVEKYGKELEKAFPKSKHSGKRVLRVNLEVLRLKNYTSFWRMNKVKKIIVKYNPFKEAEPSNLRLFYLILLLKREIKKDLSEFLKKAEKELRKK